MAHAASGLPFDDIRSMIDDLPPADRDAAAQAWARDAELTKPAGSLGRLEEIAAFLAAWQGKSMPSADRPSICVFAANHGVAKHGVSAYPQEVTRQMLENFSAGGAAINQLCTTYDIGFKVFDLALDIPTGDITVEPAMDDKACVATMAFGMEALAGNVDLLGLGEMGIANTTPAAAIYAALYGGDPLRFVGRGTGVDEGGYQRKCAAVTQALATHAAHLKDPLEIMRRLGGREIAAIAGAIVAARMQRVPVVLDGYVATAAAALLHAIKPSAIDHCLAGHCSAEGAHAEVLERLGKKPLLDLSMRLGEGSGAALAIGVIKGAIACHRGMATFAKAGVASRQA